MAPMRFGDWTEAEEEVSATDSEQIRVVKRLREMPNMQELIDGHRSGRYRDDELVRVRWWWDRERGQQHMLNESLGMSVGEFAARQSWPVGVGSRETGGGGEMVNGELSIANCERVELKSQWNESTEDDSYGADD